MYSRTSTSVCTVGPLLVCTMGPLLVCVKKEFLFPLPRSATIVLCYLMKYKDMTLIDAHSFLKKKRSLIRPNLGFWANLVDYEYCLFQKNTVNMIKFKEGWEKIPDIYSDQFKRLY